jgi:hypothetical protein
VNVTREVVADLLPLYVSGEASPATRALVEAWLRDDPELAREAQALAAAPAPAGGAPFPDLELRPCGARGPCWRAAALGSGLRDLLQRRSPSHTSITFEEGRIERVRMLVFDYPGIFGTTLALGIVGWVVYFSIRRRLR